MIVPRARLIVVVGAIAGTSALIAAAFPSFTWVAAAVSLAILAIATFDARTGTRSMRGLSVHVPDLIRTVRDRVTTIPFSIVNTGMPVRKIKASLEMPEALRGGSEIVRGGGVLDKSERFDLSADFEPSKRGEFPITRCRLAAQSRFGLWSAREAVPVALTVRVYPNLLADESAAGYLKRGGEGSRIVRQTGKGREFEKLRDYSHGDAFDEVDWKATARRGKPVVRVFQTERTQEIYVAIDASRLSARPAAGQTTLEHYVNASLVMGLAAEAQGDRFGLVTFSDRIHKFVRARSGKQHYGTCRDAIFELQPRMVEPDFGELFAFLATRLTKRALVVILTALDDPLIGETFERHVSIVSRRHLLLAAMVRPRGAVPLFETAVEDEEEIYQRLAGHLRWRKLFELQKECRRKGVGLHLLKPEKLSGQLTGLYLDVKRRQRL